MGEKFKLVHTANHWHIMARKSVGAASEGVWVSLGGCTSQIVAVRVYLALMARRGR